jgi:thiosulfate/3-mercaptopyruvate sulfurtransferase
MIKNRTAACILLLLAIAAAVICDASAECALCKGSAIAQQDVLNNEWAAFLGNENSSTPVYTTSGGLISPKVSRQNNPSLSAKSGDDTSSDTGDAKSENAVVNSKADPQRGQSFSSVLVPIGSIDSSGIILDISPNSTEYIPGAINIPYTNFLNAGGVLKPVSEMAGVLGDAGISEKDAVLIYGECQPCGGGPSAATYVYWIMKYLGHKNVKLLDGSIDDWVAAKQPTTAEAQVLPRKNYTPTLNTSLLATYEYVHSKMAQIVDARTAAEFKAGSIPGAVNIPYDMVLDGKKIKGEADLQKLFATLRKDKPVVVYTNTGVKASMVWFALSLLGYDARIYSWQDWQANQPKLNVDLLEATAQPNPAKTGDVVQITVVFAEENQSTSSVKEPTTNASNETVLTIKGCATCGFGSPQGFADLSSNGGVVQIGATSQAQKSAADNGFKVTAVIHSQAGAEVSRVIIKRVSGDKFAGIWNANVAAGVYKVDIVASIEDVTKTFTNALQIEVNSTNKYKNLGN